MYPRLSRVSAKPLWPADEVLALQLLLDLENIGGRPATKM
jgi:hypothetical protein